MAKNKPWENPAPSRAPSATRERRRVLIVCEDSKSSRYYFESFPVDRQRVEFGVVGTGMNTDSLVEEAVRMMQQAAKSRQNYSEVWCIFDRDNFPLQNYARAFQLAQNNKIKVAWANEAFELWYLLHFCYVNSGIPRNDYKKKLQGHGLNYDKTDKTIYAKVEPFQATAIRNASKLEKYWNSVKSRQERENPSTGVHKLVEYLNELASLGNVNPMSITTIPLTTLSGASTSLASFPNQVLLIVNVASKCGLTPQYTALEALYQRYKDRGFSILGFPSNDFGAQEPGTNAEIATFCSINYPVTFPLFAKTPVTGPNKHPLYAALIEAQPTHIVYGAWREGIASFAAANNLPAPNPLPELLWNFEKFLVGRDGKVLARFAPDTPPDDPKLVAAIEKALG